MFDVPVYVCPGCAQEVVDDDPRLLYWEQGGPNDQGSFTIAFVPNVRGADEVVVHDAEDR